MGLLTIEKTLNQLLLDVSITSKVNRIQEMRFLFAGASSRFEGSDGLGRFVVQQREILLLKTPNRRSGFLADDHIKDHFAAVSLGGRAVLLGLCRHWCGVLPSRSGKGNQQSD